MRHAQIAAAVLALAGAGLTAAALAAGDGGGAAPPVTRALAAPHPGRDAAAPHPGLRVWAANGCGSCHTFAPAGSTGPMAPDLTHSLRGLPAEYVRTSIVDPDAVTAAGWDAGGMPHDYAERIAPADLDRLVAFLAGGR